MPILFYTSTPFRGLEVLLQVYGVDTTTDQFAELYQAFETIEGVEYIGSVPHPELAKALSKASILAYPNSFP